ncbi:MAG: hypothetical protein WBF90_37835 [Rivularia sp. (in: cyanobacteria)]
MARPALSTSATGSVELEFYTNFEAATSLEQQIMILCTLLQRKENDYNRANPTETPKNRIVIQPDYEESQVNMTLDLLLGVEAVSQTLSEGVVEHIPSA